MTTTDHLRLQRKRWLKYLKCCLLATLFSVYVSTVRADSWPGPQTREVFSASREYFVRVIPGDSLGDTFGFAGEKKGKHAAAEFYRRQQDRSYRLVGEAALLNPVAPVDFFVSDDGRLATIDNWHNLGYGKVVAIYDRSGRVVQSYALRNLFDDEEIKAFGRSVSSIHWRNGPAYIREDQKTLLITVKSGGDFLFGLETGRFQYCETRENTYRCRSTNQPRNWLSSGEVEVNR